MSSVQAFTVEACLHTADRILGVYPGVLLSPISMFRRMSSLVLANRVHMVFTNPQRLKVERGSVSGLIPSGTHGS